jgi:hypothetical protein
MKNLLLVLMALGSFSTQASTFEMNGPLDEFLFSKEINETKSYFEILGNLYEHGTLPDVSKISNIAHSGRCFESTSPNEPTNVGLIVREKKPADVGPIGNNAAQMYEAFAYRNASEAPNYYDFLSIEQLLKPGTKFYELKKLPTYLELRQSQEVITRLKVSDKYIVLDAIKTFIDGSQPSGITNSISRCYFFIPGI